MGMYDSELFTGFSKPREFERKNQFGKKTVHMEGSEINVLREVDVLVVGGGPGGVSAAVNAARAGAKTLLVERYGHLGGMATGGLVNIIPNLGTIYGEQCIGGFCQELIDRLKARDAASFPVREDWGAANPVSVAYYMKSNMMHFYVRKNDKGESIVLYTAVIDPEVAKDELQTMVFESGAELLYHSWVSGPIMDGNRVAGAILETKTGRQAVLAKVVIDSTGDGDLLPATGIETDSYCAPGSRLAQFGWIYWICNVKLEEYDAFRAANPEKLTEISKTIRAEGGTTTFARGLLENQEGVVWMHRLIGGADQTDVEEMTFIDADARRTAVHQWELLKKYMPGFEKSFIMLSNPQLGISGSRRAIGEYYLTRKDMDTDTPFEDTIAVFADNDRGPLSLQYPRTYVPYRSLVPKGVEGLLVACRAFSADYEYSDKFNLIPHCMCFGQAAGIAAAIAVREGISVRDVPYAELREQLLKGGVILPKA